MRLRSKQPGLRGEQQRPSRSRPARSASFSAWCQVCAQGVLLCVHGRNTERICHQNYPPSTHDIVLEEPCRLGRISPHSPSGTPRASRIGTVQPSPLPLTPPQRASAAFTHAPPRQPSQPQARSLSPPQARRDPSSSFWQAAERFLSVAPGHPSEHISPRQPAKAHRPPLHHRPNHPAPLRHRSRSPRLICPRPPLLCLSCRRAAAGWRPGGR